MTGLSAKVRESSLPMMFKNIYFIECWRAKYVCLMESEDTLMEYRELNKSRQISQGRTTDNFVAKTSAFIFKSSFSG